MHIIVCFLLFGCVVCKIIVPTTDGVRNTFLLDLLIRGGKHVLTCGPTGTGKTVNIAQYLMGQTSVGGRCVIIESILYKISETIEAVPLFTSREGQPMRKLPNFRYFGRV